MLNRTDIVYVYDGSYEGLLCCIFESFARKEIPFDIQNAAAQQLSLYPSLDIATDMAHAERVRSGIRRRISEEAYALVELGYFTCHPQREQLILDFVRLGMKYKQQTLSLLTNDTVRALQRAVGHLTGESHQLKGFVRFSVHSGVLVAVIEPKNYVLPLLAPHFCDRYANDAFIIYDAAHGAMLAYRQGKSIITSVERFEQPEPDAAEQQFRSLWKTFYNTIGIEQRYNPRCRMGHMQKRYWKHLTEMDPDVPARAASVEQRLEAHRQEGEEAGSRCLPEPFFPPPNCGIPEPRKPLPRSLPQDASE